MTLTSSDPLIQRIVNAYDDPVVRAYCTVRFMILRQRFLFEIGQYLPDAGTVLDIGCGSGRYCVEYLRMGKNVVGVDMAAQMLQIAERICKSEFPDGRVTFRCANYLDCKFDEKFDAAVLMGLFDYVEDPGRLLRKVKGDVTKFIFASFPRKHNLLNSIRKVRYRYIKNCPLYYHSKEELELLMKTCGFNNYEIADNDREFYLKVIL